MATKQKAQYGTIEGTFVYAKVGQPDTKYQSTDKEWSIEVIVDEDTADAWNEQFKKQPAKKIKASEFEAKYKIEVPTSLKNEKNVFGIKLKRQATIDGVPVDDQFRPKVFVDDAEGSRTEIGQSRLIANGSFGKVSYYISTSDFGTFARLQNVLMEEDNFIEYESSGGSGKAGDEFGSKPVKTEAPRKEVLEARPEKAAPNPKAKEPIAYSSDANDSEESPF
jgi:hypothetical protein